MYRLINKETQEVERLSNDRIFFDESKYDLEVYDPVERRQTALNLINNASTIADIKAILRKIVKEIT